MTYAEALRGLWDLERALHTAHPAMKGVLRARIKALRAEVARLATEEAIAAFVQSGQDIG